MVGANSSETTKFRPLESKLIRSFLVALLLVLTGTLVAVAGISAGLSSQAALAQREGLAEGLRRRGELLVRNHALAMRSLAEDNAFGALNELVEQTVRSDEEVIFGAFIDGAEKSWAEATDPGLDGKLINTGWVANQALDPSGYEVSIDERSLVFFASRVQADPSEVLGTVVYGLSRAGLDRAIENARAVSRRNLLLTLAAILVVGLAAMAFAYWRLRGDARTISEPVESLTRVANAIASGENVRAEIQSGDEIETLAGAFNQMLQVQEDTTRELENSRNRALEASRVKDEFMANMSHEIRTPMNGVIGMTKLLLANELPLKSRRYVELIDSSAATLMTIINDILDFSKLQSGKYELNPVESDLRAELEDVTELMASTAHAKGIELALDIRMPFPARVLVDADRVRQIVSNLVSNAIKFTDAGQVAVSVWVEPLDRRHGELTLTIEVDDSGIGISPEGLSKLFTEFTQVDGSMVRRYGGTGLGLSICKRLAKMMNGDIAVRSELGKGSVFTAQVKVEAVDVAVPDVTPLDKRVLVLEANPRVADILLQSLRAWGLSVHHYDTIDEAISVLQHSRFDVAIVSASERIVPASFVAGARNTHWGAELPFVLLARMGDTIERDVATELSAQLSKPPRTSELYNELVTLFSGISRRDSDRPEISTVGLSSAEARGRALVVDDNPVNQYVAAEMLEQFGFEVGLASNGQEAVDRVLADTFDVVFMDCQMPIMDGYSATRAIRSTESQSRPHPTPIVALTAHAMSGERERVLDAGMDEYLVKPIRPRDLEKMLRKLGVYDKSRDGESVVGQSRLDASEEAFAESDSLTPNGRSPILNEVFLEHLPVQLDELRAAVQNRDSAAIGAAGHKLKGGCRSIGANRMATLAARIERHGKQNQASEADALLLEFANEFDVVRSKLEHELEEANLDRVGRSSGG